MAAPFDPQVLRVGARDTAALVNSGTESRSCRATGGVYERTVAGRHGRIPSQVRGVHPRASEIRGRGRRLLGFRRGQAPAATCQTPQQSGHCARRLRVDPAAGLFGTAETGRSLGPSRRGATKEVRAGRGRLFAGSGGGIQFRSAATSQRDGLQARLRHDRLCRRVDEGTGRANLCFRVRGRRQIRCASGIGTAEAGRAGDFHRAGLQPAIGNQQRRAHGGEGRSAHQDLDPRRPRDYPRRRRKPCRGSLGCSKA